MARKNTTFLTILKQVEKEQSDVLAGLKQVNDSETLANLKLEENPELQEIFNSIAEQSTEIAQHLGEINEKLNG